MATGYTYKLYNNQVFPRQCIMDIEANSPTHAIKLAGFDWIKEDSDGQIIKTRRGIGYTNAKIFIYFPEDVAAKSKPSFTFERIL